MLRFLFIMTIAAAFPFSGFALTVEETVSLALENNNNIKNKEYSMSARKLEADSALLIYFPSIGITYEYDYNWDDYTKNTGVKTNGDSSSASVYLNFNVFNGLADISSQQLATLNYDMSASDLETVHYDVILEAQDAFINVLKAQSDLKVAESNLELLKMQKRDAQLSADNGLIAQNDLLQVEVYLASAELQRITAASALTVSIQNLEKVINRPLNEGETLVEPQLENVEIPSEEDLKNMMFDNRSDLRYLEQSYQASKKNETYTRSNVYPKVDLRAGYYFYGDDVSAFRGNPISKDNSALVGVTASWNLLSAATSSLQTMAKKRETQAIAYSIADTKQNMTLQLQSAIEANLTSKAQLKQAEIGVTHAEENYRVTKNLYDQSAVTMTDLLDASSMLNQAKMAKSTAVYGVISSVYQLERIAQTQFPDKK